MLKDSGVCGFCEVLKAVLQGGAPSILGPGSKLPPCCRWKATSLQTLSCSQRGWVTGLP